MSLATKTRPQSNRADGARPGDPEGELIPEPGPPTLETLSPSRAADFKQCPRLFRYRSIDRIPETPSTHQARGTAAHLALERLFDLPPDERTSGRLYDLFREIWTSLRSAPEYSGLFETLEEERAWGMESLGVIANYLALEDPVSISPLDSELDMSEEMGDITVRGILDRLDERPDGRLVITDYKTGSAPPERFALPAFFALKIYALLVRSRFGRTPAELRLMYLGNSTVYSIPVSDRMLDGMQRQLLALATAIRRAMSRNDFPPRPSVLCGWCSFQDICPAVPGANNSQPPKTPRPELVASSSN